MNRSTLLALLFFIFAQAVSAQQHPGRPAYAVKEQRDFREAIGRINRVIPGFRRTKQRDSLVAAYTQKAALLYREKGAAKALPVIDSAVRLSRRLPQFSPEAAMALMLAADIQLQNPKTAGRARTRIGDALARIDPVKKNEPAYAALYAHTARLYLGLNELASASRFAMQARAIYTGRKGKNAAELTDVYRTLCELALKSGQNASAEKYGREMLRLAAKNLPENSLAFALVQDDLGSVYENLYRYDRALEHRQHTLRIVRYLYKQSGNTRQLLPALQHLGDLYARMGQYYLAGGCFEKVLMLQTAASGAQDPAIIPALMQLANVKRELMHFDASEKLYRRAYNLQKGFAPDHAADMARVETQFGDLVFDRGQFARAARMYTEALGQDKKAGQEADGRIVASTRTRLAGAYTQLQRFDDAIPLIRQTLDSCKNLFAGDDHLLAGNYNAMARTYLLAGRLRLAARYSDSVFLTLLHVESLPANGFTQQLPYTFAVAGFVRTRAEILNRQYATTGMTSYADRLLGLADEYARYLETALPAMRMQASAIKIAAENKAVFNQSIELCWLLYMRTNRIVYAEKAFAYAERGKALTLRLAAENPMVDAETGKHSRLAIRDRNWRMRVSRVNASYLDAKGPKDSLSRVWHSTMQAYRGFQDSLVRSGNHETRLKYALRPAGISEIRNSLLDKQHALVEYAVTDSSVFAFLISDRQFRMIRKPVELLRDVPVLQNLQNIKRNQFTNAAYRLYSSLVKPFQPDLARRKILIVPDGQLFYLNFETLITSPVDANYTNLPYLIRNFEISTLLSATSALKAKSSGTKAKRSALIMAPVFTNAMKQAYRRSTDDLFADTVYLAQAPQPYALPTARAIRQQIKADVYAGPAAVESVFRKSAADYGILQLETRADINNVSPDYSRIFLAKPAVDSSAANDGDLYAYELYAMPLQAEMAVISAGETNDGKVVESEGVMAMVHSFFHAGCPSVLLNLWKTDAQANAGIIAAFYKAISSGDSKSEALRKAKLAYLGSAAPERAQPYYWAGMTLIGDSSGLYSNGDWMLWSAFGVILVLLILMIFRLRRLGT